MENTDDKLYHLIHKLREANPMLDRPQDLTEKIMTSVAKKKTKTAARIIMLARPWISVAAVFFIGLYIFQQNDISVEVNQIQVTEKKKMQLSSNSCLSAYAAGEGSFLKSYSCYIKQAELKNKSSEQMILKLKQKL